MANMGYCRFENTYRDLRDCLLALKNGAADNLSESELKYALWMMGDCEDMLNYKEELEDIQQQLEEEKQEEN